jgi:hypothetical protein
MGWFGEDYSETITFDPAFLIWIKKNGLRLRNSNKADGLTKAVYCLWKDIHGT